MRYRDAIYLDYQASAPLDPDVLSAMQGSWQSDFANPHAAEHALGWRANAVIEAAANTIGAFAGVGADHVVFTSGATEANWLAIAGAAEKLGPTGRIIISAAEHKSVEAAAESSAARYGLDLVRIGVDRTGAVDIERLGAATGGRTVLVSVIAVGNEVGTINDIEEIRTIIGREALLHVDASQAPAAVDVASIMAQADLMTLSSHKVYGPKGIGVLLGAPETLKRLAPLMAGGAQQGGLRPGTVPTPLCVGFARALAKMDELRSERERISILRDRFVKALQERCGGVTMIGAASGQRHPGNACLRIEGVEAQDLLQALQPRIAASSQSACNSGSIEPSHVLVALGLSLEEARECVRFSLGRFSDLAQIEEATALIATAIAERRALTRRLAV